MFQNDSLQWWFDGDLKNTSKQVDSVGTPALDKALEVLGCLGSSKRTRLHSLVERLLVVEDWGIYWHYLTQPKDHEIKV